jgi:hypothetical protein
MSCRQRRSCRPFPKTFGFWVRPALPGHFVVLGSYREVPIRWLARYGELAPGVAFYFVNHDGAVERLRLVSPGR